MAPKFTWHAAHGANDDMSGKAASLTEAVKAAQAAFGTQQGAMVEVYKARGKSEQRVFKATVTEKLQWREFNVSEDR